MKQALSHYLIVYFVFIVLVAVMLIVNVDDVWALDDSNAMVDNTEINARLERAGRKLEELVTDTLRVEQEIAELRAQLLRARGEEEQEELAKALGEKAIRSGELQTAFEAVATAGDTLAEIKFKEKNEKFSWQNALLEVFQPLIMELQKISEKPREIERLRSEQAFFQSRIPAIQSVLHRITYLKSIATSALAKKELEHLELRWSKRLRELKSKFSITSFNLEERLNDDTFIEGSRSAIQGFFSGRGLNILLAFLVFVSTYVVLFYINVFAKHFVGRYRRRKSNVLERLFNLIYQLLIVIAAVFAALSVLYFRGDWIILGVALILLVGIAWTLRYSLPHMLLEMKVLLNMGPVREHERIVYNGIPWKIMSLGVYSILANPWLRGGTLRLPLKVLAECQSRPFNDEEPWFPSRENDYVLLDDGVYGKVVLQSPEVVKIDTLASAKFYTVDSFLQNNPRNLSMQGFLLLVEFGLDYQLLPTITNEVRSQLEKSIAEGIKQEEIGHLLKNFSVKFNNATASSLNFMVMATFNGSAAGKYYSIQRTLQSLAVDACNHHGWAIPFDQLTVHLKPNE
ncbi:MAG: hypothetical protein GXP08_08580 [Gammaproteobacteria bacterium]|nr:hypothetical protein [Gammaproteobacteria bacterium]